MTKIKVLCVLTYISKNGGVQTVALNYFNYINKNKFDVTFLTMIPTDKEYIKKFNIDPNKIFYVNGLKERNIILLLKEIHYFFKKHHDFDIIHCHQTDFDPFFLREAKRNKIPVRIMHSHNTKSSLNKIRIGFLKTASKYYSNVYLACSKEAGKFYFGNKITNSKSFYVINNAINIDIYKFNDKIRESLRKKYDFNNNFVICNVSRITDVKNQLFLIEVFNELYKLDDSCRIIFIGDGPLKSELEEKINKLKLNDVAKVLGVCQNVPQLLMCSDIFVLPSLFEGVPLTVIEAMATGLPCILSDTIDSHVYFATGEEKISLQNSKKIWAKNILKYRNSSRLNNINAINNSGFNIEIESGNLEKIYIKELSERKINNEN